MEENALVQAVRHVREGEERIARQVTLVATLDAAGHAGAVVKARELLVSLRVAQELAYADLRALVDGKRRINSASRPTPVLPPP